MFRLTWKPQCTNQIFVVADGVVRLYRNYDPLLDPGPVLMVSSFRGLNEIVPMRHGSGVVMDWKQSAGILLVGGDSKAIKTWDAQTEIQGLVNIPLRISDLTSLIDLLRIWIPHLMLL